MTLKEIRELLTSDGDDLVLALHEGIWEEFQQDLARGTTRNKMKPLMERYGGEDHPLLSPDARQWDRLVVLPYAEVEWPKHLAILRESWPGDSRKHPPVTRLAVRLWLERLYQPDLGFTTLTDLRDLFSERWEAAVRQAEYRRRCRDLLDWQVPGTIRQVVSTPIRSARAKQAVLYRDEYTCRNPRCIGQPYDVTDQGAQIVHVDHILELGNSGPDDPEHDHALP